MSGALSPSVDGGDLHRFVTAQEPVYPQVLAELRQGLKTTHWMWFIFPQITGLGTSPKSVRYAIRSIDEARAYLDHSLLRPRLRECASLVLTQRQRTAEDVFEQLDAKKLRSCMTLFHRAMPEDALFLEVLDVWFGGGVDEATDTLLGRSVDG